MNGLHQIFGGHTNEVEIVRIGDAAHQDIHLAEGEDALQSASHDMFDRERLPGWPFRTLDGANRNIEKATQLRLVDSERAQPPADFKNLFSLFPTGGVLKARWGL